MVVSESGKKRQRILDLHHAQVGSSEIADIVQVKQSIVSHVFERFKETGTVERKPQGPQASRSE